MSAFVTSSEIPKLLTAGMKTEFMKAYETSTTDYQKIVTEIPSNKNQESYSWLGGVPQMKRWKDERTPQGLLEHDFTIKNLDWESSISVDRNAIEDDLYGQIKIRVRELGVEARRFFDELVFTLLGQADQTSGVAGTILEGETLTCYDSKACCATNHIEGESGTQGNYSTSALNATNLQSAISAMNKFKSDKGKPRHIVPDLLVVGPDLQWKARELLNSVYYPEEGVANSKLANNVLKGVLGLLVTPYLTDSNDWFVLNTKSIVKPLILQLRKSPKFDALDSGTESLFMRKKMFYGVDARFNAAFGDWRNVYGNFPT